MNYFKVFMDIDEQLLNQNTKEKEAEKAGDFRAKQREAVPENTRQEADNIREAVRQNKASSAKELLEKALTKNSLNPFLETTDGLLKAAWENLIPSWGLTLFWIDIHAFLNKALGPWAFRELGEEWIPASIKKIDEEKSKEAAAMLRIVEGAGCGCLNLGCLFIIIAALSLVAMIVSAISDPLIPIKAIFGTLWHYLTGGK
ncbi:MAG: hypothetical protein WCK59_01005 [Candidatus Falkowbacteria bacterium]